MKNTSCPKPTETLLEKHFSEMEDPRRTEKGNLRHFLSDILLLSISAILCGAEDWQTVHFFGKSQIDWLKQHGNFENGIPSSDTLRRVFSAINPKSFNNCFIKWIDSIRKKTDSEIVAVDGKSIKGANPKKNGKAMPHIVSAFAVENGLCLGQLKVDEKSNEISAIPELLDLLALESCTVTIDAMGCQTDIVEKIIENDADYIIAVKGNQGHLQEAIADTILLEKAETKNSQTDFGHGRVEKRTCYAYSNLSHIYNLEKWKGLQTIVKIETEVFNKTTKQTNREKRYYISSLPANAELLNNSIRKHWAIENNLHWTLDVTLGEDKSRKRFKYEATNYNILLKMILTLLNNDKTKKISKKNKRLKAALEPNYRTKLIFS